MDVCAIMLAGLVGASLETLYFLTSELRSGGQSLGKKMIGLRVLRDDGFPVDLRGSVTRNLLRIVDTLPMSYLAGLCSILATDEGKRLGDLAAGTIVIRHDRPRAAEPVVVDTSEGPTFRFSTEQLQRIGDDERRLVRQTLRRLDGMPKRRRQELVRRSVGALRARLQYEPVPPEQGEAFLRSRLGEADLRG